MIGLRFTSRVTKRTFISLRKKPLHLPPTSSTFAIPSHEVVDEERCPSYNPQDYYTARPGETLGDNYQLLAKIGWGTSSTVWLARDMRRYRWQSERTVALKILNSCYAKSASHLLGIEETVAKKNPLHLGYDLKLRAKHLLIGEVTLDLKLANILMTFENEKAIPRFIQEQVLKFPMHYKTDPVINHTTYQSHNGFGSMDVEDIANALPKITDFGSAWQLNAVDPETKSQNEPVRTYPIQPNYYRAPEVVLGYGWDFSADIWNFGVLVSSSDANASMHDSKANPLLSKVWNIIEGTELFTQVEDANGRYNPKSHLAEMIALLGPPPKEVIERADFMSQVEYDSTISIEIGKPCKNAREVFGGPYFDEKGIFLHEELIPNRKLEDTIPSLDDSDRELFLSFARDMLTWVPSERKTARELTEHPFLNFGGHVSQDVLEGRSTG
ncbi:hypothetical protein PITC_000970 [Penicillium italicum]|uniref:Protein kinase domain-containing protein n=1 Tax=Penicillium italicum TaxID=40296 RepID=A0A0A2KJ19_PENIT|nr:hypothetical protein PITC_000970 [Penicillium italicum]